MDEFLQRFDVSQYCAKRNALDHFDVRWLTTLYCVLYQVPWIVSERRTFSS